MSEDPVTPLEGYLNELERIALAASPSPWRWDEGEGAVMAVDDIEAATPFALSNNQLRNTGVFIAYNDPSHALREVRIGRQIIGLWREARATYRELSDQRARSGALRKPEPGDAERRAMDMADAYERVIAVLVHPSGDETVPE